MKQFRVILYTWCLLLLLGCGVLTIAFSPKEATASEFENRMLEAFPSHDAETVFSGEFALGMERYLSDRFIGRQKLIDLSDRIMDSLSLLSKEQKTKLAAMDTPLDAEEDLPEAVPDKPEVSPASSPEPVSSTPEPSPEINSEDAPAASYDSSPQIPKKTALGSKL